jgi:hypothetical protein
MLPLGRMSSLRGELSSDNVSLGTDSVMVDGAEPRLADNTRSSLCELVAHCAILGMPMCTTPGDAILAPESSGDVVSRITRLLLQGPAGSSSPPIDWGRWRTARSMCVHRSP